MADTDVIQGTLDMLILKSLSLQPIHAAAVRSAVQRAIPSIAARRAVRFDPVTALRAD